MTNAPSLRRSSSLRVRPPHITIREHTVAELEHPDGTIEEIEQDRHVEADADCPSFMTETSRTVKMIERPIWS